MIIPFGFLKKKESGGFDVDAQAYIDAISLHVSPTTIEQDAINTFVTTLKAESNWSNQYVMYLPIWANSSANAINLKNVGVNDITWGGTVTHASTGVTSNGTTGYGNTGLKYNALSSTNITFGFYSGTSTSINGGYEMGCNSFGQAIALNVIEGVNHAFILSGGGISVTTVDSTGLHQGTRTSATDLRYIRNGTVLGTDTTNTSPTEQDLNIYILAWNSNNSASSFSNLECRFSHISEGLTDTQASNFYTALQTLLTTLNKEI